MFDMSGSGQIINGSLSTGTGGTAYLQSQQLQGTPNHVIQKYGSYHQHGHNSSGGVDFDRENNLDMGGGSELDMNSQTMNGQKVRLPEIAYGVSQSTVVSQADGTNKMSKTMNNYNSDPYALRLN